MLTTVLVQFVRAPLALEGMVVNRDHAPERCTVIGAKNFSDEPETWEQFARNPLHDQPWIHELWAAWAGTGQIPDGRPVIKVVAADGRSTYYVAPEGYGYARYAGRAQCPACGDLIDDVEPYECPRCHQTVCEGCCTSVFGDNGKGFESCDLCFDEAYAERFGAEPKE